MPETASEPGGWWPTPQMHTLRAFAKRIARYETGGWTEPRILVKWRLAVGILERPECLDHLTLEDWQTVVLGLYGMFDPPNDDREDWVGRLLAAMRALPAHVELFAEPDKSFMCFELLWDGLVPWMPDEVLAQRGPEFADVMIEWAETGIEPLRASAWNGLDVLVREVRLTPAPVALYDRALLERAFAILPGFEEWVMRGYYPKPLPGSGESTM